MEKMQLWRLWKAQTICCGLQMILRFAESISAVAQILQFEEKPNRQMHHVKRLDKLSYFSLVRV